MLDEKIKDRNFTLVVDKLKNEFNLNEEKLNELLPGLKDASFSVYDNTGLAYDGSLINGSIELTSLALKINELLPEKNRLSKDSIKKVCLLQHISKAIKIIPSKDGRNKDNYAYNDNCPRLKTGEYSGLIAMRCGIEFTDEEFEALVSIDVSEDDKQAKFFSLPLAVIVKQANELLYTIHRKR